YQYARAEAARLIGRSLELIASILSRSESQMLAQLYSRLMTFTDPSVKAFLLEARQRLSRPSILTKRPSLTSPGAEISRLEGHTGGIAALALLPDGRLASCSHDSTIRLWDLQALTVTTHLRTDQDSGSLLVLGDGRLAFSTGVSIGFWNVVTGVQTIEKK